METVKEARKEEKSYEAAKLAASLTEKDVRQLPRASMRVAEPRRRLALSSFCEKARP